MVSDSSPLEVSKLLPPPRPTCKTKRSTAARSVSIMRRHSVAKSLLAFFLFPFFPFPLFLPPLFFFSVPLLPFLFFSFRVSLHLSRRQSSFCLLITISLFSYHCWQSSLQRRLVHCYPVVSDYRSFGPTRNLVYFVSFFFTTGLGLLVVSSYVNALLIKYTKWMRSRRVEFDRSCCWRLVYPSCDRVRCHAGEGLN